MKRIISIGLIAFIAYIFLRNNDVDKDLSDIFKPDITIADLKKRPSVFADSTVELRDLKIVNTQSVVNYSHSIVSDKLGNEIMLLSARPYSKDEVIDSITGKYVVIYAYNDMRHEVFIADDLNRFNDLIKLVSPILVF